MKRPPWLSGLSKTTAAAAVAIAAAITAPALAEAATPVAGTTYQVSVTKSGKCLDLVGGSTANGGVVQQWSCSGDKWQQFTLNSVGSGTYALVNVNSGKCLDIPSGTTNSGVQLQQWSCAGSSNQQWRLVQSGSGTYQIVNVASGLCLANKDASTASGAPIIQESCTANTNKQWLFTPVATAQPTVASDGTGRYRTVQAAIDAVPANNTARVTITIKPGTYREVVTVPSSKPLITLQGLGASPANVTIVYHNSAGTHGTSGSASMFVHGRDFTATNLTIANDFDENSTSSGHQAVALHLNADRAVLRNVRLLGDQDTFLVNDATRAYVRDSYVEGTVDFIFGGGTIVFDNSDIYEKRSTGGPITAASTPATKAYGFLFHKSRITGAAAAGTTTLGRPWRPDAQVVYRESTLNALVKTSQPWTDMSGNSWRNARFSEYRNTGPGAGTGTNRPQLTDAQAANHTPQKYLAGSDGWNPVG
ncbi:pectinesterase family protein [Saccharothrix luteola]|uniref:pectinesterase family protein n=1 Tax=Saccharothrix luteola TaxID=2893018 RepID=UPI001E61A729|nr:pectinesterase family protein [Saccharothrix luteola]MCC8246875.1 pectinesterase family protein [Saccharothrix luteola]